jgi:alpha-beta hydrolase superfamily lysophospholipase
MSASEPFVTYLELRESTAGGEAGAGLSHTSSGLVLLHVLEIAAHGEPRGAVTVVHDAGEHGGRYLALARSLAERGWSVALPDLRGHGRSEGEVGHSAGIREVLRDLGDVQDHLAYRQPEAPRVLVGQGLGALQCLAFASDRPDGIAALVLSAPILDPRFDVPETPTGLLKAFKKVRPTTPGRLGWQPGDLSGSEAERRARAEDPFVRDVITVGAAAAARELASTTRERAASLPMPTLVIRGTSDPIATSALAGPALESVAFEGLRHDLFHETRSAEVVAAVADWLDRNVPR